MTDEMKEKLSALVDNELNELDERRVLRALERDVALRNTWERYHLARSALRGEEGTVLPPDMAARVAARLGQEPLDTAILRRQKITRLAGMTAIAASVAFIAIVGVQTLNRPDSAPAATLVASQPAPEKIIRAGATRWDLKEPETESALNHFLVEHNEFASPAGIGGMMPYVRVVGYDNPK